MDCIFVFFTNPFFNEITYDLFVKIANFFLYTALTMQLEPILCLDKRHIYTNTVLILHASVLNKQYFQYLAQYEKCIYRKLKIECFYKLPKVSISTLEAYTKQLG